MEVIRQHFGWFIVGALTPVLIGIVAKKTAAWFSSGREGLKGLINEIKDPALRAKVMAAAAANVSIAEFLIPDRGTGAEKFAWVQKALIAKFPGVPDTAIKAGIQMAWEAVWNLDDAAKAFIAETQTPIVTSADTADPPAA